MKCVGIYMFVLVIAGLPAMAQEVLADLDGADLRPTQMPDGVAVEAVDVGTATGVKVTYSGTQPISVVLAKVPCEAIENTRVLYQATVSSEGLAAPAYLELNAVVDGNTYFSRALNDVFQGNMPARESSTPFFLQAGQPLEKAFLGVRFEGPGALIVGDVRLLNLGPLPGGLPVGAWMGIAGAAVGILTSGWVCVALFLAWKGRGRGVVLGVNASLAIAGVVSLVAGSVLYSQGAERDLWYGFLLLGAIVATNYTMFYFVMRWVFGKAEERRMAAMDM